MDELAVALFLSVVTICATAYRIACRLCEKDEMYVSMILHTQQHDKDETDDEPSYGRPHDDD